MSGETVIYRNHVKEYEEDETEQQVVAVKNGFVIFYRSGSHLPGFVFDNLGNQQIALYKWKFGVKPQRVTGAALMGEELISLHVYNGNSVRVQQYDHLDGTVVGDLVTVASGAAVRGASIAALADGGFVIVWDEHTNDQGFEIYGKVFDPSPSGPERRTPERFRINTYSLGDQALPRVAALDPFVIGSTSGFVVAWESKFQDGFDTGIFAQIFSAVDGTTPLPARPEFRLNTNVVGAQSAVRLATRYRDNMWHIMEAPEYRDRVPEFVAVWRDAVLDGDGMGIFGNLFGLCQPGFWFDGKMCVVCPAGFFCKGGAEDKEACSANAGSYCPAGTLSFQLCPAGYFCLGNSAGPNACVVDAGRYCPEGTATPAGSVCPVGSYCTGDQANKSPCLPIIDEEAFCPTVGSQAPPVACPAGQRANLSLNLMRCVRVLSHLQCCCFGMLEIAATSF